MLRPAEIGIACGLALTAFLIFVPFAGIGLDPHHDGIMLKPALDVADGQVLFRDTFSKYGPLTTFLQAAVLRISPTLLALKVMAVGTDSLALGIFYLVWRSILPRSLAVVSAAMFVLFNPALDASWTVFPWSSDIAMAFQAVAWLALVQTIFATRRVPWAILLGAASAAVFWCRQPVGLSLVGTLGFVAAGLFAAGWPGTTGRRAGVVAVVAALGGMAAVSGVMLGYLWANDALPAWWFQNIVWPRRWAVTDGAEVMPALMFRYLNPFQGLLVAMSIGFALASAVVRRWMPGLPGWVDWLSIILTAIGVVCLSPSSVTALHVLEGGWRVVLSIALILLALSRLIMLTKWFAAQVSRDCLVSASLAAVGLASLTQIYPIPCHRHSFWAVGPTVGVAVYALWRASSSRPVVLAAALAIVALPNAWLAFEASQSKMRHKPLALTEPDVLSGIRVDSRTAFVVAEMADSLRRMENADSSRHFTMIGGDALPLACVRNRTNLSPMYVTWPGLMSPQQEAQWAARFRAERPFVILQAMSAESAEDFFSRRDALIEEHAYRIVGEMPGRQWAFLAPAESAIAAGP